MCVCMCMHLWVYMYLAPRLPQTAVPPTSATVTYCRAHDHRRYEHRYCLPFLRAAPGGAMEGRGAPARPRSSGTAARRQRRPRARLCTDDGDGKSGGSWAALPV